MSGDSKSSGIGTVSVIQVVFIILKLTGLVAWKWRYVLLPIEVEICLWILILIWIFIKYLAKKIFGW